MRLGDPISDPKNGYVSAAREAPKGGKLAPIDEEINRIIAMARAKTEHPFRVIRSPVGHTKTRYRGLAKNRAHLFTLFALGNLFLVRRRQPAWGTGCQKSTSSLLGRPKKCRNC